MRRNELSAPWAASTYVAAVQSLAYAMERLPAVKHEELLRAHSTNVRNLRAGRWHTLLTSAFLIEEPLDAAYGTILLGVLAGAESLRGPGRMAGVFTLGHVGATLLVYGALRAVGASRETVRALDVGASYGFNSVLGALAASVPHRGGRAAAVAGLVAAGVRPLLREQRGFSDAGHLVALLVGLGLGHRGAFTRG